MTEEFELIHIYNLLSVVIILWIRSDNCVVFQRSHRARVDAGGGASGGYLLQRRARRLRPLLDATFTVYGSLRLLRAVRFGRQTVRPPRRRLAFGRSSH